MKFDSKYLGIALSLMMLLSISRSVSAQGGVWTWMNGSDTLGSPGNYGQKGVPSVDNEPPGRYQAAHWKDRDGNFWIFGGLNLDDFSYYSDLWRYNPNTNEWTWVNGPNTTNAQATYGEKGIPSPLVQPPCLSLGSLCWYDGDDGLYLYGGWGIYSFETSMWKYSIENDEWVWLTGTEFFQEPEEPGFMGVSSALNTPGARAENETCWTYENELWFSCGQTESYVSSMTWNFDLNSMEWTWMHGPNIVDLIGVKGNQGEFDSQNYPGSRMTWSKMSNGADAFMFSGNASNELWHFNTDSLAWRFLGESDGYPWYEDYCMHDDENIPVQSGEMQTAEYFDECKEFLWLYGGLASALWAYDLNEEQWVLPWGTPGIGMPENYGEKGVPSLDNIPPRRGGGCMWSDDAGNLWLFGGTNTFVPFSDMWRFEPDYSCISLGDTSSCCELTVSFRISHTMDSSGSVEIQVVDGEGVIEYSIDGGMTWFTENFFEDLPPGDYDIVVRDENGCLFTGTITILDISVGTSDLDGIEMSLSPNPVEDILTIELEQLENFNSSEVNIRVIDQNGRLLLRSEASLENSSLSTKMSLRNLTSGSYYIHILIDDQFILKKISKS